MAYDLDLADRTRAALEGTPALTERKMFGGLAFLLHGHMAVVVSGQGGLMVRTDPDEAELLLTGPGVSQVEMRGRPMSGWVRVDADRLAEAPALAAWIERGLTFAGSLPPKA